MKIAFDYVKLSRDDPREEIFLEMLYSQSPELKQSKEALAFPVFGRGRVISGVPASRINEVAIGEMCEYLCGKCSCTVKSENPGMELLMDVPWAKYISEGSMEVREVLPPLSGVLSASEETQAPVKEQVAADTNEAETPVKEVKLAEESASKDVHYLSYFWYILGGLFLIVFSVSTFIYGRDKD